MVILPCLPIFFTGSYLCYIFLLVLIFGLFYKIIHL